MRHRNQSARASKQELPAPRLKTKQVRLDEPKAPRADPRRPTEVKRRSGHEGRVGSWSPGPCISAPEELLKYVQRWTCDPAGSSRPLSHDLERLREGGDACHGAPLAARAPRGPGGEAEETPQSDK
ncbi:hypothetical protein NDU88_000456 [Pleurodeles waltl]|uniref:Uncharacterized protein n=1 Tax=Pleurodeles waltl TaxID=8319 RepID=A0AAV7VWY1_PLEWA|nr:hypothetical protein NDU88_000456 [Pleurodeles waltl]